MSDCCKHSQKEGRRGLKVREKFKLSCCSTTKHEHLPPGGCRLAASSSMVLKQYEHRYGMCYVQFSITNLKRRWTCEGLSLIKCLYWEILTDADSTDPACIKKAIKMIDKDQRLEKCALKAPLIAQVVKAGGSWPVIGQCPSLRYKTPKRFTKSNQTHGPPRSRLKAMSTVWCPHSSADRNMY